MSAHFISDLHLQDTDEPRARILLAYLGGAARQARALYLLGDLFEAWIGDDDDAPIGAAVAVALRTLSDTGVAVHLLHGNRDFLIGRDFVRRCGARLLPDPCVIDIDGEPVLISHGDLYCTDDHTYLAVRQQLRDPRWQGQFLAQPMAARRAFAAQARQQSAAHQQQTSMELMDVNADAIRALFVRYGVRRMIHGHTHRPAEHALSVDGRDCQRWVLADWRDSGEVLIAEDAGWRRQRLDA